ncbi:NAD-dependent epimerase/dehydratase family protein [Natronomonas halophila]|uniref:NAD-dependent epimerase/dehydratase family protein n=1 Tax=Natronomonas halophila TaxID=2747817 RepID=UPI0015B660FE|nr:NAD-dependent epimerase/dehydratase family protein [Natronomonas halophila]QLD87064.1 NAD-dependent epimerase/dehydratase family protein [Natronomonas halophila]
MDGERVLVTGGAGFIGSHLVDALHETNDVAILDAAPTGEAPIKVEVIQGDIRNEETVADAVADTDVVFHEAALVSVAESIDHPKASHATNATGTLNVLEAARRHDARVVAASSAAIYGHPEEIPVSEAHSLEPTSPYGIDKLATDHYTRRYHDLYGLETVALRYFNVYGPDQTGGDYGVIKVFFEQARNGDPITVHGDGTQTRDFVHIEDVVQANLLAAETDAVGEAYNVGTGDSITIRELAELIRNAVGSDSKIVHTDPREGDIDHSRADIDKARDRLGYEPEIELEEGLKTLV